MWRVLYDDLGQTRMTGAEMLLRAMPWIDDVRVMTGGKLTGGLVVVY